MPALLDTNAISDLMSNHPTVVARAGKYASGSLHSCVIAVGEVRFGIERLPIGKKRTHLETRLKQIRSSLQVALIDEPIAEEYARLKAELESQGLNLGEND